ncbi:MAG: MerR family transcriptional regulator [Dehalococcoidia bacterium]
MRDGLTIGEVTRRTGLPEKTIRFYEEKGIVPAPARTNGGYRLYTPLDVRRLRLVRQAKLLGLSLPEIRTFVEQAFASECADFAEQFLARIAAQRAEIDRRIVELENLKGELDALADHVGHSVERLRPGQRVAGCEICPILDAEAAGASAPIPG